MRIVLAGALGEVGRSLHAALGDRGHEVIPVSARAPRPGRPDVLGLPALAELARSGSIDALVHAGGSGDHRPRTREFMAWSRELLKVCRDFPAILISTIRVIEGYEGSLREDSVARAVTAYGRANAELEALWREVDDGSVLRLVNFFGAPSTADAPQTRLLPWSLVLEGWQTGEIAVRSQPSLVKEFVDAGDVACALDVMLASASAGQTIVAGPGLTLSMQQLVEASVRACSAAGRVGVRVSFGDEAPATAWQMEPNWLAEHGWASTLNGDQMIREMTAWLVEWGAGLPASGSDRG